MIVVFKCLLVIRYYCLPHPLTWLYMEYAFSCWASEGLASQAFRCESVPTSLNLTYILPMIAHGLHACAILSLPSTCQPVDLSTCQPATSNIAIYGVCILLRGSWGLASQAFRCESMPTSLNLTYTLPYDCRCFARMRNSFTSVDLSTCRPVSLSTCQPVDMSTC